jgi:uncharacterized BrkB/YihY/UPF0761 family membrane protein
MTMQTMMDSSNPAYKPVRVTRQLRKKALAIGLSLGLLGGLFVGPLCGLVIRLLDSPIIVLIIGLLCGQFGGQIIRLILSSFACIQHFTLRFILYRNGHTPWNYARFLDYAAERIFLRKVGGGYIFVHRLLQDYFASLYQSQ